MQRPSLWIMAVVLLVGIILLREPRFADVEDRFLGWLLSHRQGTGAAVPLTVVEIGRDALTAPSSGQNEEAQRSVVPGAGPSISPLEFALFLQSVLEFQPGVIAFENILRWHERDKDQEQVFLDQAMRAPSLVLASELGETADPDAQWGEIRGFPNVKGKRGHLAAFVGVERHPAEDLRLISTPGYTNLPPDYTSQNRVPLLFLYRGEVIPSFPLQAALLWMKITPAEVKVVLGSHIELPGDRRIPVAADGTLLFDPNAATRARRMTLNELLLAAQQRDTSNPEGGNAIDLRDQIVLARTPANPLTPPDVFAATIATIQSGKYLRRVSKWVDYVLLLMIGSGVPYLRRFERFDLLLYGIAATAAYSLIALGALTQWNLWLPGVLPLGAIWFTVLGAFIFRRKEDAANDATIVIPPPIP
jgi:hypothetical protein